MTSSTGIIRERVLIVSVYIYIRIYTYIYIYIYTLSLTCNIFPFLRRFSGGISTTSSPGRITLQGGFEETLELWPCFIWKLGLSLNPLELGLMWLLDQTILQSLFLKLINVKIMWKLNSKRIFYSWWYIPHAPCTKACVALFSSMWLLPLLPNSATDWLQVCSLWWIWMTINMIDYTMFWPWPHMHHIFFNLGLCPIPIPMFSLLYSVMFLWKFPWISAACRSAVSAEGLIAMVQGISPSKTFWAFWRRQWP